LFGSRPQAGFAPDMTMCWSDGARRSICRLPGWRRISKERYGAHMRDAMAIWNRD